MWSAQRRDGEILSQVEQPLVVDASALRVILMVIVNGVGKTTTIGKLAKQFRGEAKKVMLAAGDTFRAAAVEQLPVGDNVMTFLYCSTHWRRQCFCYLRCH